MNSGSHGHVFCANIQFHHWTEALRNLRGVPFAPSNKISTGPARKRASSGMRRRPLCTNNILPASRSLQQKPCMVSIRVSKRYTFGSWVSTQTTFGRQLTTTHHQPTPSGICQPRTPSLILLAYPFLKQCSTWTSRSEIIPCFGRSRS